MAARAVKIGPFFSFLLETYWSRSGAGQKSFERERSGCEKNWLEREWEVAEWGSGVTEIGLSGERKFCRSRSALVQTDVV